MQSSLNVFNSRWNKSSVYYILFLVGGLIPVDPVVSDIKAAAIIIQPSIVVYFIVFIVVFLWAYM